MKVELQSVEELQVEQLKVYPVWRYVESPKRGETAVRLVKKVPVTSLTGKLVGTQVRLNNGNTVWALLGNIDSNNPKLTKHFLTLSVERDSSWFSLARYHDFDCSSRGPRELARFLELPLDHVFPISYDITKYVIGDRGALSGIIEADPKEKFTRAEIIAMAVP
jgi:hypothetical protein